MVFVPLEPDAHTLVLGFLVRNTDLQYNGFTGDVKVFATGTPGNKVGLIVDSYGSLYYLSQDNGQLSRIDYSGTGDAAVPPSGDGDNSAPGSDGGDGMEP